MSGEADANIAKRGRKTAYLATLPPDVMSEILCHLSSTDLAHLSQTCRSLYHAATTEHQFSLRLPQLHNQKGVHPWSTAYRRFRALLQGPSSISIRGAPCENADHAVLREIIGVAGDTLVLYDGASGRLVAFPTAWTKNVGLCISSHCIMVGNAELVIAHCEDGNLISLERIDVHSGRPIGFTLIQSTTPIKVSEKFCRNRTPRRQVAMSAGTHGDHLMFVSDMGEAVVLRIEDGVIIKRHNLEGDLFSALVRGVDGGWWSGDGDGKCRVVGILRRTSEALSIEDVLSGEKVAEVSSETEDVIDAVLVGDGRVAVRAMRSGRRAVVRVCYFKCDDGFGLEMRHDVGIAGEAFCIASCEFSVGRGGDEVRILPMGTDLVGHAVPDGRMCRVWCGDEFGHVDSLHGMRSVAGIRSVARMGYDWGLVSDNGGVAVACCRSVGLFAVFELNCGRCVTSFQCSEGVVGVAAVGQHWVVAIGRSGRVHEFHFGALCDKAADVRRCCGGSLLMRWDEVLNGR